MGRTGRPRTLDHSKICTLYKDGSSVVEITKITGCSEARVYSILLENGTHMRGCKHNETVSSKHPLYSVWRGLLRRCSDKKHHKYPIYGGRGIRVCEEWSNNFDAFATWALAAGYRHGLQIDRSDNDSGYSPDNCRWVTRNENNRNRRCVVLTPAKVLAARAAVATGTKTILEVAKLFGVKYQTIYSAVRRITWVDVHS